MPWSFNWILDLNMTTIQYLTHIQHEYHNLYNLLPLKTLLLPNYLIFDQIDMVTLHLVLTHLQSVVDIKIWPLVNFYCLPSYREGFPISILEAAAMGIPTIGTRIVGISDAIIENETGLLCEPKNPIGLAKCMDAMFDDDALRRRLGSNARQRAERYFRQSEVVSLFAEYIKKLT